MPKVSAADGGWCPRLLLGLHDAAAAMAVTDGWAIPDAETKSHYFVGQSSLCRLWSYSGPTTPLPRPAGNHCRVCAEKAARDTASTPLDI